VLFVVTAISQLRNMILENIKIRRVTNSDILDLQKIGRQTFFETFSAENKEENMKEYLESGFSKEKLKSEVEDEFSEVYFAELGNKVLGYLKVNFGNSQTEIKDREALEIERIYVLKEYHGKQVGQLLYNKALELAQLRNFKFVWLGVWEKNPRAIRFYKKNGFVEFDKHIFNLGGDLQTDIMMKLSLNN